MWMFSITLVGSFKQNNSPLTISAYPRWPPYIWIQRKHTETVSISMTFSIVVQYRIFVWHFPLITIYSDGSFPLKLKISKWPSQRLKPSNWLHFLFLIDHYFLHIDFLIFCWQPHSHVHIKYDFLHLYRSVLQWYVMISRHTSGSGFKLICSGT